MRTTIAIQYQLLIKEVMEITDEDTRRILETAEKGEKAIRDSYKSQDVLIILAVINRSVDGKGSLVEVLLFHPKKDSRPDIQAEFDLASLGELESIHGPYCDPPRWMVSYKGKVSAKRGNWINPKVLKG
jgi:hypothetical protein